MNYPKLAFVNQMKKRTKTFTVDVINLCDGIQNSKSKTNIVYQIIRSASSCGANYRATCQSRSKAEFYSKISITIEETDETLFWLEIIEELNIYPNQSELKRLKTEATELLKILSKARKSTKNQSS